MEYKLVSGGDWEGLYIGDYLQIQDHALQLGEILQLQIETGMYPTSFTFYEVIGDWLYDVGELPVNFNECGEMKKYETCN